MAADTTILLAKRLVSEKLGLIVPAHHEATLMSSLAAVSKRRPGEVRGLLTDLERQPANGPTWQFIASRMTVGETCFFRHRAWFDTLVDNVLAPLVDARRRSGHRFLRLWSAGCSTGEEPYSLAMSVARLVPDIRDWSITILGTDVNPEALATAASRRYGSWSMREVTATERDAGFEPAADGRHRVKAEIARLVRFAHLNLADAVWQADAISAGSMDVILCRNVLMYFPPARQKAVVRNLSCSLLPDGWLVTSPAESGVDVMAPLLPVRFPSGIFFRRTVAAARTASSRRNAPAGPNAVAPLLPGAGSSEAALGGEAPAIGEADGAEPPRAAAASLLDRPRELADAGLLDEGRNLCRTILQTEPQRIDVRLLMAEICAEMDDDAGAFAAVREALFLEPMALGANYLEAMLLFRFGNAERGARRMQQVVSRIARLPADALLPFGSGQTVASVREMARQHLERYGQDRLGMPDHAGV